MTHWALHRRQYRFLMNIGAMMGIVMVLWRIKCPDACASREMGTMSHCCVDLIDRADICDFNAYLYYYSALK